MKNERITAKDLITTGLFTAIIFIVSMAVGMLGFIPIFIPFLTVIVPLICGIPFMLFLTKTKKFGMITIMGALCGFLLGIMGMGVYWVTATGLIAGFCADLIFRSGNYASAGKSVLCHGVFSLWVIGALIPIIVTRDAYFAKLINGGYGEEYANALMRYVPDWSLIPMLIACFVAGVIGALIGKAILKKHFVRAGIA